MATAKTKTPAKIRIDFRNEESSGGGGKFRVAEGDYHFKIASVVPDTSNAGNSMLVWTFVGVEGKVKGKKLIDRTVLTAKALWKVRQILEAIGVDAPEKSVLNLDAKKIIGKELGITLMDGEPYKGKVSSEAGDYMDLEVLEGADEDEDEEDVEEDEEESEDEESELDELDRAGLKAYIKDNDLDISVKKSMSDDDIREAIQAAEGDEEDEEEDEEDENEDDGLDDLDRAGLKKHIKDNDVDVTVKKSMSDDDIRTAIREADGDEIGALELEDDDL